MLSRLSPAITAGARYRCKHCPRTTVSTSDAARMLGWRIWSGKTFGGQQVEDVVCPQCAGTAGPAADKAPPRRLPWRAPQSERHHYLFVDPCGCPRGLTEATATEPGGPPRIGDDDEAWADAYSPDEERAMRKAGVRVVHVDHATYERDWFELMRRSCPHKRKEP